MYIITGATGQTGSAAARTLLEKGLPVKVIVRSQEKGQIWKDAGAEVAVADLLDAEALSEALAGGKVLYLMNPPNYQCEDLLEETENFIESAKTAIENSSLEKLVVLSSIGADLSEKNGVVGSLHLLEKGFQNMDIPVTFLRPPSFMENWNSGIESVENEGILPSFYFPLDKKIPHISAEDVGRLAAEAMLEDSNGVEIKELKGFELSAEDFAEAFSKASGKQITAVPVPADQSLGIFRTFCTPRNAELLVELNHAINNDLLQYTTDEQIKGKVTVNDYAERFWQ